MRLIQRRKEKNAGEVVLKGIITDLDGTLISGRPAHKAALIDALERFGHTKKLIWREGLTSEDIIKYNYPEILDEEATEIADTKKKHLINYLDLVKLIPGANELLQFLKSNKVKICLLTNNSNVEIKNFLEHFGWTDVFDGIVGKEDGPPKPSPEPVKIALDKLNLNPEDVIYLGDTDTDIQAATAAGVRVMLSQAVHTEAKMTEKAEFVVVSLDKAKKKIEDLMNI